MRLFLCYYAFIPDELQSTVWNKLMAFRCAAPLHDDLNDFGYHHHKAPTPADLRLYITIVTC
jgi:hypothetical protein